MNILVLNSGSSSLKYKLFRGSKVLESGLIDRIGLENGDAKNHNEAVKKVLLHLEIGKINAIGHRVVHGGEKYKDPVKINAKVIKEIKNLCELAPLHNPPNLAGILACQKYLPKVSQVAVFDTAFHQTLPEKAFLYGLPYKYYSKLGIRRYGFHGTSHKYVTHEAIKMLKKKNAKVVTVHLGNGSSIAASKGGKSVDTSMGFTPLEGLIMGTRCGDLDPAIVFYLQEKLKIDTDKIDEILNKESGLKGLSGISSDMRKIYALSKKGNKRALLMIEILGYRIAKYVGAYTAVLNGLDAIVFTAGMGEKAFYVRKKACGYLKHLGLKLDNSKNRRNALKIHASGSKVKVFVIPTNEELQISREVREVVKQKGKIVKK
ncbi:MAG: acetate kinase [Patescibacteria group bacterium]|nr:acetate kinase [Patescibacteria group bacterium]